MLSDTDVLIKCFLIAIITGLFFGTGIALIRRIKPRDPDPTNTGAAEGDDRSFRHPDDGH